MFSKRIYVSLIAIAIAVFTYSLAAQAPNPPAAAPAAGQAVGAQGARGGQAAAAPQAAGRGNTPWPGLKRLLLVADVQTGYHHDALNHEMAVIERIGRQAGAYMTMIRTDSQLITKQPILGQGKYAGGNINAKPLDFYDAVFLLPSGDGTMTEQQKKDLLSFVRDDGKGLIVGHASGVAFTRGDASLTWPEWGNLIGGMMDRVDGHSGEFRSNARIIVEDPDFPGAMAFGSTTFMFEEQHPVLMAPYSREKSRVILRLDPASLTEQQRAMRPDGDFPVVWVQQYGKGRVYHIGWGEFDATFDDERIQKLLLEGIKWAIGMVPGDATPRPMPKAAGPTR